jgi:glycine/D-amino acid oxidase-like deaminating enzyme
VPSDVFNAKWGNPPWTVSYRPERHPIPESCDVAVVGAGFGGLAAAAWLKRLAPERSTLLFESGSIGSASSGYTGGLVLADTAGGMLPGLGDVLAGYTNILRELRVECELELPGVWEVGRTSPLADSPISWNDSGTLSAVCQVPGGAVHPCLALTGLARAAEESGALIFENTRVEEVSFAERQVSLRVSGACVTAKSVIFTTNAMSLELTGLIKFAEPKFTLALVTEPLSDLQINVLGMADGKPFYTIDFPYLWGRRMRTGGIMFGAGLVHLNCWRELGGMDVTQGEAANLLQKLENRVHALHPVLKNVGITHRWGGPILIPEDWRPIFMRDPRSPLSIVLGAYSGHGVALSAYLGAWAAEATLGRRELPDWKAKARRPQTQA